MTKTSSLSPADYEEILETVRILHQASSISALLESGFPALTKLIPNDLIVFQYFHSPGEPVIQFAYPDFPFTQQEVDYYEAHSKDAPWQRYVKANPGVKIFTVSDCLPIKEWLRHPLYLNCKARLGFANTLISYEGAGQVRTALSLDRKKKDFSLRDRLAIGHIAKHLFLCSERLLEKKSQKPWREPVLKDWLATELGVTNREAEVLLQLRNGLRNEQIAKNLGLSPATVKKHLENAYAKLGVSSRHAACAKIVTHLSG